MAGAINDFEEDLVDSAISIAANLEETAENVGGHVIRSQD